MKKILSTIALMTVVTANTFAQAETSVATYLDENAPLEERVKDALSRMTLEEKTRMCYAQGKFSSPGVPRLGIPEIMHSDGPHGVRAEINWNDWGYSGWTNDYITAFPALTCLASTWNPELARQYGKAVGEEARYRHKTILLGPGVNIMRTPLNGRNFEYMGEDPMLAGTLAVPYIQGLQSNNVACCLKHFALNNQEEMRMHVNVEVSDRALYEIYLPAFKKAVQEGGAWSIMGAYNRWQGTHCCHNDRLLNKILKGEWGFKGAVVTDWGGCHVIPEAIFNGTDIEMGTFSNGLTTDAKGFGYDDYCLGAAYLEQCKQGKVPESIINDKAARILRIIFQTTMSKNHSYGSLNTPEHVALARQIANEGIVLLKNSIVKSEKSALLPLDVKKYKKILVVGENATRSLCSAGGSSELKPKDEVSPLRGLKERFGNDVEIEYAQGYESGKAAYGHVDNVGNATMDKLRTEALEKAKTADLIIYIGGANKNHQQDCEGGDRTSFSLSYDQDKLIEDLVAIQPKTIVIIVSGTPLAMPWTEKVPSLVQSWYLGSEAGHSLADILSGDVNPSGKVPFTYAKALSDYPSHQNCPRTYPGIGEKGKETVYFDEGIYVGYRYFDTKKKAVAFPFGYGLSYTTFQYGKATASAKTIGADGAITFSIPVKNTGKVEGKETVQLYIGDDKASVERPTKELKAFQKVTLAPGEEKIVTLTINSDDLKYYDEDKHGWIVEPGTFKAYIGASVSDIKAKIGFSYE